ncbi:MAG: hypothetical protein WDW36_004002 [Sanguina aurantia]
MASMKALLVSVLLYASVHSLPASAGVSVDLTSTEHMKVHRDSRSMLQHKASVTRKTAGYTSGSYSSNATAADLLTNSGFYLRYGAVIPHDSWDWRAYPAVVGVPSAQGMCAACYSFSTVNAIEAIRAIKTGATVYEPLSKAQVVDCSNNFECAGGWMPKSFQYAQDVGLLSESAYTYSASLSAGNNEACQNVDPTQTFKITSSENVPTYEGALQKAVSNQPVVATIDASSAAFQKYTGQVPFTGACSTSPARATHSVLVVGYYTAPAGSGGLSYWILKNSWGADWGDNGYFYLAMGSLENPLNSCGILNYLSYPVLDGAPTTNMRLDLLSTYCYTQTIVTAANTTSLYTLAGQYNVTVQELLDVNLQLSSFYSNEYLEVNEHIFIPPCTAGAPPPPVPTADCGYNYYPTRASTGGAVTTSRHLLSALPPPPPPPPYQPHGANYADFSYTFTPSDAIDWSAAGVVNPAPAASGCTAAGCTTCSRSFATAVAASIESIATIMAGPIPELSAVTPFSSWAPLSANQILDCSPAPQQCGGALVGNLLGYASSNGILPDDLYASSDGCNTALLTRDAQANTYITGFESVASGNESALQLAVSVQPVVAVIAGSSAFLANTGGIFSGPCSSAPSDASLSVLIVGYTPTYWIVRTDLAAVGKNGIVRIARGSNVCGIANFASYPVAAGSPKLTFAGSLSSTSSSANEYTIGTSLTCNGSQITSLFGTSYANIDSFGIRCKDGYTTQQQPVGNFDPTSPLAFSFQCPSGYDAVEAQVVLGSNLPPTQLSFRCSVTGRWTVLPTPTDSKAKIGTKAYNSIGGSFVSVYCPPGSVLFSIGGLSSGKTPLLRIDAHCGVPTGVAMLASFYEIASAAGVTLSDLLAANPSITSASSVQDFIRVGIRVPGFCQIPIPHVVGYKAGSNPCSARGGIQNIGDTCNYFCETCGYTMTQTQFLLWNKPPVFNGTVCGGNSLVYGTSYCIQVPGSGINEDYVVADNCVKSYEVLAGDSCPSIAANLGGGLTALRLVHMNIIAGNSDVPTRDKCAHISEGMLLCVQYSTAPSNPAPPPPPPPSPLSPA